MRVAEVLSVNSDVDLEFSKLKVKGVYIQCRKYVGRVSGDSWFFSWGEGWGRAGVRWGVGLGTSNFHPPSADELRT